MKKIIYLSFISCLLALSSYQEANAQVAKKAFFVELMGNGITFSANYDTRFTDRPDGIGGRIGIGYVAINGNGILTVPVMANYLLGKNGRYFEIGLGALAITADDDVLSLGDTNLAGTMSFMYRRQPVDGGFMWRIGFAPVFSGDTFIPYWVGLGLGYAF